MTVRSNRWLLGPAAALAFLLVAAPAGAQDLEGCDSFQRYVADRDYVQALEELDWCRRSVADLHTARIAEIVTRPILEYEPGQATSETAMGFAQIETSYRKGSDRVTLTMTSGESGAAATGLGALAGLASALGVQAQGTKQVRVAGQTATLDESGRDVKLTVTMDGGMLLVLTGPDAATVQAFAEELLPDLEDYLG